MKSVISKREWLRWCGRQGLLVEGALFALETCYYGLGWRTRPGTLLLTETELIHHSYSWRDTFYAIFEPSIRVVVRLSDVAQATMWKPSLGRRMFNSMPDAFFQLVTLRGEIHDLVLQRSGLAFCEALRKRGIAVDDKVNAEPSAALSGGPATRSDNSAVTGGPPSVS
jgi:hypothetical protein